MKYWIEYLNELNEFKNLSNMNFEILLNGVLRNWL